MSRLLIVPGLHDSPADHWQTWLQRHHRDAVRVQQRDWQRADLDAWAEGIGRAIDAVRSRGPSIAVAHSFGVLALLRYRLLDPQAPLASALLVAPADPALFGVASQLPQGPLDLPATLVLSRTDPWLAFAAGWRLARTWGTPVVDLGNAGHVNVASGHRTLPLALRWVRGHQQRVARAQRSSRADWAEWSLAI